jgi:hypothetical protein
LMPCEQALRSFDRQRVDQLSDLVDLGRIQDNQRPATWLRP